MGKTNIEWTRGDDGAIGYSWNPVRGCSRISEGCRNCYAERQAARFSGPGQPYEGLVRWHLRHPPQDGHGTASAVTAARPIAHEDRPVWEPKDREARWTGVVRLVPERLADPLRWRRPRRVFVNSMSDLFHESLSDEDIAAVFWVMAACPQHTFQVLTKRAERMRQWFTWLATQAPSPRHAVICHAEDALRDWRDSKGWWAGPWPLPNVWLGVSVEDQQRADQRIPELLATPAAVRWVSYEPALGPVDFAEFLRYHPSHGAGDGDPNAPGLRGTPLAPGPRVRGCCPDDLAHRAWRASGLWVVIGGESGPGARPFDLAWARSTIRQCHEAGVPCFVKQLGGEIRAREFLRDRKGGDPLEWPEDIRVREWPR